jgi:hypothetical protein
MPLHSFTVGQSIEFVPARFDGTAQRGTYTVVRQLPNDSSDREYRVRNVRDGHERVVRESQIRRGPAMPLG